MNAITVLFNIHHKGFGAVAVYCHGFSRDVQG